MISREELARFPEIWKRVEAARPKLEGSAKLMPRKKKRPIIRILPQSQDRPEKTISSAFPG